MAEIFDLKVNEFMARVITKNPGESEFHQAVQEVVESLFPFIEENPKYQHAKILERMVEPERALMFRVPWLDDNGQIQINSFLERDESNCHNVIAKKASRSRVRWACPFGDFNYESVDNCS